jgi:hypothetical protein
VGYKPLSPTPQVRSFATWLDGLADLHAILLAGGDKSTQAAGIKTAIRLPRNLQD